MSLPEELTALLIEIGDAVVFDEGVRFRPTTPTGREDPHGYLDLNFLYGLQANDHGLMECINTYQDQFPANLVPIGEALGGDQICLDRTSPRVIYWKHDVPDDECTSEIAPTFTDFITRLEPDPASSAPIHQSIADLGILEDESHLDF